MSAESVTTTVDDVDTVTEYAVNSFMCIRDMSTTDPLGGFCMEANINGTNFDTYTWAMNDTDFTSKIAAPATIIMTANASTTASIENNRRSWGFGLLTTDADNPAMANPALTDATAAGSGPITSLITQADPTKREFKGFGMINCTLTTISMDCINWVVSEAGETAMKPTAESTALRKGGYKRFAEGSPVAFYWFDGRDISAATQPLLYTTDDVELPPS